MSVREIRNCDVCQREYEESNPAWMIMMAVNAPPEVGEVSYDFCTFECLEKWVTTDDDGTPFEEPEETVEQVRAAVDREQVQRRSNGTPQRPPGVPTLAEALAMGLKPDGPR